MPDLWLLDDGRVRGGGQLWARRLARATGGGRLVCRAAWARGAAARGHGVPVEDFAFPDPVPAAAPRLAAAALALRRVLRPARADSAIVVANAVRASLCAIPALAGRRAGAPLVHVFHEQESAARPTVRLALRRARGVVAVGPTRRAPTAPRCRARASSRPTTSCWKPMPGAWPACARGVSR